MKTYFANKGIALLLSLCLMLGCASFAAAEQTADFDALNPLMNVVASAATQAGGDANPELIGNDETTLSAAFVAAFFNVGVTADASLGVTADTLASTDAQAAYLAKVFAAQAPELTAITASAVEGYIGFQPVTVNTTEGGDVQIIGEIYRGQSAMAQMTDADYRDIQWIDRAVFTFKPDAAAMNGYLLTGFSVGSELNMEEALQTYSESILVEYINSSLGFSVMYPSVFTDDMLTEDGDGLSAQLPDESASFFVKRAENATQTDLQSYIDVIANGITDSKASVNDAFNYATVTYDTEDGYAVFDVYIVTDKYIYQAELSYKKELASTYQMYTTYLENSFQLDTVVG